VETLHPTLKQRFARNLATRRKALGLTQAQLAEELSVDTETLSRFERGKHLPALVTLEHLAQVLHTTISGLIGPEVLRPADEAIQVSAWLAGLSPDDRTFAMDQLKRQTEYLRARK
jgi:hypothetical protein